jgi:hypothetical protein
MAAPTSAVQMLQKILVNGAPVDSSRWREAVIALIAALGFKRAHTAGS